MSITIIEIPCGLAISTLKVAKHPHKQPKSGLEKLSEKDITQCPDFGQKIGLSVMLHNGPNFAITNTVGAWTQKKIVEQV